MNKHGWNIRNQLWQQQGKETSFLETECQKKEFCQENDGELLPSICSIFV